MMKTRATDFWVKETYFSISLKDIAKSLGILLVATVLSFMLMYLNLETHNTANVAMIYILAVVVVSRITTGYLYGIVSSIVGVIGVNFFFTYPYFAINFTLSGYPITFFSMLVVSVITCALTTRIKQQGRQARAGQKQTELLYQFTNRILAVEGNEAVARCTLQCMNELFDCAGVFYLGCPGEPETLVVTKDPERRFSRLIHSEAEIRQARNTFCSGKVMDWNRCMAEQMNGWYLPVMVQERKFGVIGLFSADTAFLNREGRIFVHMMIPQSAAALERRRLADEQRRILVQAEKEKMRGNLLRAISHDLRTPLTGISGASSVILENGAVLDPEVHDKLVRDIYEDSQWLIRMVENLLSITRINSGETASVKKEAEAVEEIVAAAVGRVRARFPNQRIAVKVPNELLMVPMDGTLIEQVLINLIENAIGHSGGVPVVYVTVTAQDGQAVVRVRDTGKGIAEEDLEHLFDGALTEKSGGADSSRGIGIGLSICHSIIKAHGGELSVRNVETGGAEFTFTLPMAEFV